MSPAELRLRLLRNGYRPVPLRSGLKFPTFKNWQTIAADPTESTVAAWSSPAWDVEHGEHAGTGLVCGALAGVDIDIIIPALADRLESVAMEFLGLTPLRRIGRAPRVMLMYRQADTTARLVRTPELLLPAELMPAGFDPDDQRAHVEVRAAGEQVAAFAIHPDTGRPYVWTGATPLDVPMADLPEITADDLRAYLVECERILREAGAVGRRQGV